MDRLERLRSFFVNRDFNAVVLTRPGNIAAFFRGSQISLGFRQEPPGRVAVCVTEENVVLLGNQTEVCRVAEDELSWLDGLIIQSFRWDEWDLKTSVKSFLKSRGMTRVYDDSGSFGENISKNLREMYYPLSDGEIEDIRELAMNMATIVEHAAKDIKYGTTEVEVAGKVAGQLVSREIWPEFIMVAADERIHKFRHCIPKKIPIQQMAHLSGTVHRKGLYVSLTRLISLGKSTPEWQRRQEACNRIDAKAIAQSKPGISTGEVFKAIMKNYAEEGYPDEWMAHHQGGPAGFYGRDYKATEYETRRLRERQPVVWNPTLQGAKSEDTILTGRMGEAPEILTETGNWEYYSVSFDNITIRRPAIFEKQK
jgi:Xaa-Pro aminopeptidase